MSENALPVEYEGLIGNYIGNFRIDRFLGAGGMGVVFEAFDELAKRRVAIKMMLPELARDPIAKKRFLTEARITASMKDRNVVSIYAVEDNAHGTYFVMEYLRGRTLEEQQNHWRGTPRINIRRFMTVLRVIARAHAEKKIHRDIKSANVFLAEDEETGGTRVKVLDFGLARDLDANARSRLTLKGDVFGTPESLSPEQWKGEGDADARTDVWALGVLLYELLANRPPFQARNLAALAASIMLEPVPDLQEFSPWKLPPGLVAVIAKALEKDPNKRYADAGEFLRALESLDLRELFEERWCDRELRTPEEQQAEAARFDDPRARDTTRTPAGPRSSPSPSFLHPAS